MEEERVIELEKELIRTMVTVREEQGLSQPASCFDTAGIQTSDCDDKYEKVRM